MSATRKPRAERGLDFFSTPAWCTRAILKVLTPNNVFDPCAGEGAILDVAREQWPAWTHSGYEIDGARASKSRRAVMVGDALDALPWRDPFGWRPPLVVMNPPFNRAIEFVERALSEVNEGGTVAALLRLGFLEGKARADFHWRHPADVHVLPRRPSFTGRGTDASAYAWFVWGADAIGGRWAILQLEGT